MKINGKSKTPIIAAQTKKDKKTGGNKARASKPSKNKTTNGVKSAVLERISEGVLALDAGMNYTYINERAGELLGCPDEKLLGRSLWQAHPGAEDSAFARACRRALQSQTVVSLDGYFPGADRWLEGRVYPAPDGVSVLFREGTGQAEEGDQDIASLPAQNPNPVLRFSREGRVLYANPASAELQKAWETRAEHTTPLAAIQQLLPAVLEENLNTEVEIANDAIFYAGLLVPVREKGYVNLYLRDTTEQHSMEELLRAREAELEEIIHHTPFMLNRCSRDLRYRFVSRAYAEMIGRTPEELIGKPILEIMGEEGLNTILPHVERVLRGEQVEYESQVSFQGGVSAWLHVIYTPDRDSQGNVDGWFASIVDLTERKKIEEEVQNAHLQAEHENLQFRALLENLPVGVMVTDADGTPLLLNRALDEIWHGSRPLESLPDYITYRAWRAETGELLGPEDWPVSLALRTGEVQPPREIKIERFDGTFGTMLSAAAPIRDRSGNVIRAVAVAQDISERKQIEQSLARERELFKRLYETMPVMSTIYEPETGTMRMNAEIERLSGWKEEEVSVVSLLQALYPDPEYLQDVLGRMAAAVGKNEWVDVKMRTRDGRTLDTLWANISIMDGEKLITGISLGIDITERKRMEDAIRTSEERFRALVSQATAGIAESDPDSRLTFVNPRLCEMLGYPEQELLGKTIWELTYSEDLEENQHLFQRMLGEDKPYQFEKRFIRKDGSLLWTNVSVTAIHDLEGKPIGGVGVVIDIEERKKAEQALRSGEERMRLAIETNRMVAWEWDPATDRVTHSKNLSEVYGLSRVSTEAEGFSLIWPEDLPAHREKVDRAMRQGGEYQSEFRITRPVDGRIAWLEERAAALTDAKGKVNRLVGVVTDISGRKRAEQELTEFARQQEALYQLADRLNRADSLEEIFDPALDAILSALQCDRASILLFDEQDVMRFVAWRGLSDAYRQATNGHSPWKRDEKNARPISMDDVSSADLSDSLRTVIQQEGIGALAFIPLISSEKLIGKFMVYYNRPHAFSETDVEISQTIAYQLASNVERKRAEGEVRESRQRLSLTYHHAPVGIVESTLDGRLIEVNEEFCQMLGYSYEELIRLGIRDVTHNEDFERETELYRQIVSGEIPFYRIEKRYICKDGSLLWAEVVRSIVRDEDGKALYGIGAVLNISERKQAEQALQQSEQRFTLFMQHLPGLAWIKDVQGRYVYANAAAEQAFNTPRHQLYGKTDEELFSAEVAAQFKQNDEQAVLIGKGIQVVETLPQSDGILHYSLVSKFPILGPDGRPALIGGTAFDITERKQIEQALLVSEQRFREIFETAGVSVWVEDFTEVKAAIDELRASGVRDFPAYLSEHPEFVRHAVGLVRILDVNSETLHLLKAPRKADLLGSLEQIFQPEAEVVFARELVAIAEGREMMHEEVPLKTLTGEPISVIFSVHFNHQQGDYSRVVVTLTDITDRKRAEDALQRARERAERAAYRMAHLQKVTAALSEMVTAVDVAKMVVEQGAPVLGAASSSIMILNEADQTLEIIYSSKSQAAIRPFMRFPLSLQTPASDAVRSGRTVWIESQKEYLERYPHLAESIRQWGNQAAIAIPMIYKGRILGVLTLGFTQPVPFSLEDQDFALTLARQAAQALERAQVDSALRLDAAIMENVPAGVYLVRASDGVIVHTNPKFDSLFGYEPGEILGRHVSAINAPNGQSPEDTVERIIDSLRADASWQGEVLSRRKDGTSFWCFASITTAEHPSYGTVWVAARQDISSQKQVEEALRESEQRYRAIITQANTGIVRKDPSGRLLFVNQAFCNMLGMTSSELTGRRIWELTHAEDVGENKRLYDRLMQDGIPFQLVKRMLRLDGSILWANVSVSPVMDVTGRPQSAVSVYVDITQRKQAEDRLALLARISELTRAYDEPEDLLFAVSRAIGEHFNARRTLFNEIDVENDREIVHRDYCRGVHSVAGEHRITDYSSVTSAEMQAGKTVVNHDSKLDPRTAPDYERSYMQHGERAYVAVPLMHENRWVASLWISDDQPRQWNREDVRLLEAIAERAWTAAEKLRIDRALLQLNTELEERVSNRTAELQAAYEFLRESEATSRLILESMPDAIVITDVEGKIVHANTQVETLFGYAPKEVLGQPVEALIPEQFRESHLTHRGKYAALRTRRTMGLGLDLSGLRKDGSQFPVDVTLSPIDNNTTWDVMVTIRDNTNQRAAQEALRLNEEKLRTLFEILPVGISFLGKDGRISEMNSALTEILGLSKNELLRGTYKNRHYIRADGTPMPPAELASRRAILEQKTVYNVETGIVKENGEIIWTSVNAAPVQVAGLEVAVVTIDITHRKQAEEALHKHRERLRVLSRRLVEVQEEERRAIARELHDRVGQNLAALTLNLNILRNMLSEEVLDKIGSRLSDSVNLVNDILTITRSVMADLRSNVLDDYGLEAALSEYADRFTQRYGIRVTTQASPIPRLEPSIEMTLLRIAQEALTNIARHAQATQASISLEVQNNLLHMVVEDNGIGILSWQKVNQGGSHGLRIMRERAEAFGGYMKVHSTYKNGTAIEVGIPLASGAVSGKPKQEKRS